MLITADVPTLSRITLASRAAPYLSLALYLDPSLIAGLGVEMNAAASYDPGGPLWMQPTDTDVLEAAWRLMRLLDYPPSIPVLQKQLLREMHYWLLSG